MPLTINLRHLEHKVLHLRGESQASELEVTNVDELVQMLQPLRYDFWVEKLKGSVLVRGVLRFVLDCQCARCLRPFQRVVELADWSCNLTLEGEDRVAVENDCVDLTPVIREDILLAFPQHPLCKSECSGLPFAAQPYPNASETGASGSVPSAWDELNKLKF
ncbi:MAG: DUF177 domain-containing protein [Verrucomicrobia bacterium]|nr:DUF177 domain-containing protein [Verrucomicrobiota bacterium]